MQVGQLPEFGRLCACGKKERQWRCRLPRAMRKCGGSFMRHRRQHTATRQRCRRVRTWLPDANLGHRHRYRTGCDAGRLWRVQVKSACHHFNRRYGVVALHGNGERTRYTSADIDILVAYLSPIETWYVIPVEKLDRKKLCFYPHGGASRGRYEAYREAWSLMAPGPSEASCSPETERPHPGYLNPRFL
jgi:hypothetical protein